MKKTDISKKIVPLGDRVLVKVAGNEPQEKNKFGIIIPDTVEKEKSEQGEVVAVGEGKRDQAGKLIPLHVKVGQTVMYSKYSYDEVTVEGEQYVLVKEENILAIIK